MIYADNAATTRVSDGAFEKMLPYLREQYGNASSQYCLGTKAKRAIESARQQVAKAIGATPPEILFTSGGSEANNWVLRSVADTFRGKPTHIVTSAIEHHSILNACRSLERTGVEIVYLPVDTMGRVSVADVMAAITPHTRLVSIMLANNEVGTIQPIGEIGRALQREDILFHTDAVQAVGHIPVDIEDLKVDFLTASAHKFNGAKGTGILYKRVASELSPFVLGGGQEYGLRAGTENVAGIVAAGYAIEESVLEMGNVAKQLQTMVEDTVTGIKEQIPHMRVNGDSEARLPGVVNLCLKGASGESLMQLLDLKGICVSTSSACTSGKDKASHVLLAMGLTEQQAKSSIRISYGKCNSVSEVRPLVQALCEAHAKIMKIRR